MKIVLCYPHFAAVCAVEAADDIEQSGFARARRPGSSYEFPRSDAKRNPAQCRNLDQTRAVGLRDLFEVYCYLGRTGRPQLCSLRCALR